MAEIPNRKYTRESREEAVTLVIVTGYPLAWQPLQEDEIQGAVSR